MQWITQHMTCCTHCVSAGFKGGLKGVAQGASSGVGGLVLDEGYRGTWGVTVECLGA